MVTRKQGNAEMVASVARSLGPLLDKVVFLGGATTSLLITDPVTKMEAFRNRGGGDHAASHDMEDIVALLDGRAEIVEEVRAANPELRSYLTNGFRALMEDRRFTESISGHLPPDAASQARVRVVRSRLEQIADID